MDEKCETCKFWCDVKDSPDDEDGGRCRRYPPDSLVDVLKAGLLDVADAARGKKEYDGSKTRLVTFDLYGAMWAFGRHPMTLPDDWCGEYAKDPDAAEVLTEDVLAAAASPAGGYTKTQLSVIGVPWPPPKGWREKAVGSRHAAGTISMLMAFRVADGSASGSTTSPSPAAPPPPDGVESPPACPRPGGRP